MTDFIVYPSEVNPGTYSVPADKSMSHRALMIASIASGESIIRNVLPSSDCLHTLDAMKSLGVTIIQSENTYQIKGVGLWGLQSSSKPIDCGNAGTAMRLLSGLLAPQRFDSLLTGDDSLSFRPMGRVIRPLTLMGAEIHSHEQKAPLIIKGKKTLKGITYQMPKASAQVKSAILLAGLYAKGQTVVIEEQKTRNHTENMLQAFSYPLKREGLATMLSGGEMLKATTIDIPGDFSSAAFLIAAGLLGEKPITLLNVGMNPTRTGLLSLLELMGAKIDICNQREQHFEALADLTVYPSKLKGIEVPKTLVSLAIDEFPIFFILASLSEGVTVIRGIRELRVKESDRISSMASGLETLGIELLQYPDGLMIKGGRILGGIVDSFGDHRVAMSFAIAGMFAKKAIVILDCDNIRTSFPEFLTLAQTLGMNIEPYQH